VTTWELHRGQPTADLRPFVARYASWRERADGPVRRLEPPVTQIPLIISFGPPTFVEDLGRPDAPATRLVSFAAGLYPNAVAVSHEGEGDAVQVDFTPLGARRFFALPLAELAQRSVQLEDLLGPAAARLAEALAEAPAPATRFALLDAALRRRVREGPAVSPDVARAWARLAASGGTARVADLAVELRCSRRHLTARFREELGLPPKALARILRFQRALRLMEGGAEWAWIAHACGYADQPHLNREFRDLAGCTPQQLRALRLPFVQDAAPPAA
jgi:AraC-like DNA-binding protein